MKIVNSFNPSLYNFSYQNTLKRIRTTDCLIKSPSVDTFTFSGTAKKNKKVSQTEDIIESSSTSRASLSSEKAVNQQERGSVGLSQKIYDESDYAFGLLKYSLGKIFNVHVIDIDSHDATNKINNAINSANENKPIVMITARRKSAKSIAEKMGTLKIKGRKAVKEEMSDLIGARIILSGNTTEAGDYVIDKLSDAVKKNHLKIIKIKNHGQEDSKYNYASSRKIDKLVETARKNGEPLCTYSDSPRDSGYLALHIITGEIADGFRAEIQIMGLDVSRFKEIEDLCYKCRAGKKVPKKYKEIEEIFKEASKNKTFAADFLEYTKRAYAYEREKPVVKDKACNSFLKIPEDLNIPENLDFNKILHSMSMADIEDV